MEFGYGYILRTYATLKAPEISSLFCNTALVDFCHCDNIPEDNNLKEEKLTVEEVSIHDHSEPLFLCLWQQRNLPEKNGEREWLLSSW